MGQFVCQICGRNFKSYNKSAKYCSQACKGYAYIKYPLKQCENCTKEYKPQRAESKYCSVECGYEGRKKSNQLNRKKEPV